MHTSIYVGQCRKLQQCNMTYIEIDILSFHAIIVKIYAMHVIQNHAKLDCNNYKKKHERGPYIGKKYFL